MKRYISPYLTMKTRETMQSSKETTHEMYVLQSTPIVVQYVWSNEHAHQTSR
jgi:hypothetical protein